jgi:hypothetical protein
MSQEYTKFSTKTQVFIFSSPLGKNDRRVGRDLRARRTWRKAACPACGVLGEPALPYGFFGAFFSGNHLDLQCWIVFGKIFRNDSIKC